MTMEELVEQYREYRTLELDASKLYDKMLVDRVVPETTSYALAVLEHFKKIRIHTEHQIRLKCQEMKL